MIKHKIVIFWSTLILAGLFFSASNRTVSYGYEVRKEHPRIYITSDNIDTIRARAAGRKGLQDEYYLEMKTYAESIMDKEVTVKDRTAPQRLKILAFLYVLGEIDGHFYMNYSIEDFGRKGIEYLKAFADYYSVHKPQASYASIIVQSMSVAYDWLYHLMTPEERRYVVRRLIRAAEGQRYHISWGKTFKDYTVGGNNFCIAGLAFYGDGINDAKAREYLAYYEKKYREEFIPGWDFATQGGGSFQGSNGHFGDISIFLYVMDAFYTAANIDDIGNFDYFKYSSEWLVYSLVPHWNNGRNLFYTDNDFIHSRSIGGTEIKAMSLITSYPKFDMSRKQLTAWLCDKFALPARKVPHWSTYNYDFKLMDLLWRDDSIPAKSPQELGLPLARHFGVLDNGTGHAGGVGIVIMKSAWGDPNATFAVFKCAPFKYTHDDHDSNSFIIHKKGRLAIDSGLYENGDWWSHEVNYAYRTIAHNSVLIIDQNEIFGGKKNISNDGGQRLPQLTYGRNYPRDFKVGGGRDIGGMERFEHVEGIYDYMRGNATRAYQSTFFTDAGCQPKISLFTRDFVYLRSEDGDHDYFVVFDKVNATNKDFKKKWLLHSMEQPEINGTFTKGGVDGKGGTNKFGGTCGSISLNSDTAVITEADGKLFSKTILPKKHAIIKIGGPDKTGESNTPDSYESYVNGVNYKTDDNRSKSSFQFNPLQGSWRIEVEPLEACKDDLFLHVLYPCDRSVTAMPETKRIETADMTGVHIVAVDTVPHWIVLFSKTGDVVEQVSYPVSGEGASRHLVCDVKENALYDIWSNEVKVATKKASGQGTLFFEVALQGNHNIKVVLAPGIKK